jgi:hypothetical protein
MSSSGPERWQSRARATDGGITLRFYQGVYLEIFETLLGATVPVPLLRRVISPIRADALAECEYAVHIVPKWRYVLAAHDFTWYYKDRQECLVDVKFWMVAP